MIIENFMDWLISIRPLWAGYLIFISSAMLAIPLFFLIPVCLIILTHGWILILIPIVVLYAWYIALFKQGNK